MAKTDFKKLDAKLKEMEAQKLTKRPAGAFTTQEYAQQAGISRPQAQVRLSKLERAGAIKRVSIPSLWSDGFVHPTTGYILVEEDTKKTK